MFLRNHKDYDAFTNEFHGSSLIFKKDMSIKC